MHSAATPTKSTHIKKNLSEKQTKIVSHEMVKNIFYVCCTSPLPRRTI